MVYARIKNGSVFAFILGIKSDEFFILKKHNNIYKWHPINYKAPYINYEIKCLTIKDLANIFRDIDSDVFLVFSDCQLSKTYILYLNYFITFIALIIIMSAFIAHELLMGGIYGIKKFLVSKFKKR